MSAWKELQFLLKKDTSKMTKEEIEALEIEIDRAEADLRWEYRNER